YITFSGVPLYLNTFLYRKTHDSFWSATSCFTNSGCRQGRKPFFREKFFCCARYHSHLKIKSEMTSIQVLRTDSCYTSRIAKLVGDYYHYCHQFIVKLNMQQFLIICINQSGYVGLFLFFNEHLSLFPIFNRINFGDVRRVPVIQIRVHLPHSNCTAHSRQLSFILVSAAWGIDAVRQLVNKFRETGSVLDKKPMQTFIVFGLTETSAYSHFIHRETHESRPVPQLQQDDLAPLDFFAWGVHQVTGVQNQ
ncbi:hypothetical protein L9F63_014919, partial [Diploptera punctata]